MKQLISAILLLAFPASLLAQTLVRETDDKYVVLVPRGMGLGEIVRSLGKIPDWVQRQWISDIQQVNASQIQTSGEILNPNIEIDIPKSAIAGLKDGNVTIVRAEQPKKKEVEVVYTEPAVAPEPAPAPMPTTISAPIEKPGYKRYGKSYTRVTALTAIETLEADGGAGTSSTMRPKPGFGAQVASLWAPSRSLGVRFQAQWLNLRYEKPANVTIVQKDPNHFEGAVGVQTWLIPELGVYADGVVRQQNYAELTTANVVVIDNLAIPAARAGIEGQLSRSSNWGSTLNLSYTSLFARNSGAFRIKEGYDVTAEVLVMQNRGWGATLAYSYKDQDTSITKHRYDQGRLGVSYSF